MKHSLIGITILFASALWTHQIITNDSYIDANIEREKIYLVNFMRSQLGSRHYLEEVLPNDFSHIIQFLEYGHTKQIDRQEYGRSILSTFKKLLGGAYYINASSLTSLLNDADRLFKPYVLTYRTEPYIRMMCDVDVYEQFKNTVSDLLYLKFSTEHDFFKNDPDLFINTLSQHILEVMQESMEIEQFKNSLHLFIESIINKMIWNIDTPDHVWEQVVLLGNQLCNLSEEQIIDENNHLDDLSWALTYRFAYFIDIMAERFPAAFYQKIKEDIMNDHISFLQLPEQDVCLPTKKEYLLMMVCRTEAKRLAYERGITLR